MARRKVRKHDLEKHIAHQQAPYLGIYDDELDTRDTKMMRLIDAKDGDFYQPSLNPNPGAQSAWDHIAYTGVKTDLQKELVAEARRYYGLDGPQLTNLPPEIETKLVEMFPAAAPAPSAPTPPAPVPAPSRPANNPKQYSSPIGPEQKAMELKKDYVQELSGLTPDQQLVIDTSLKTDLGRDLDQALLWGSLALAAGGTGGFAAGTANEQNNMTEHEEAMLYALSHA